MQTARLCGATMIGLLVLLGALPAQAQEMETRVYEGVGAAGSDSPIELYLLQDAYEHRIAVDAGCVLTAGVFPGPQEPGVPLADVLVAADLAIGVSGRAGDSGSFRISDPGWAIVQIGTGPECAWVYEITGSFLPRGREPAPPGTLEQPWVLWLAVAGGAVLVGFGIRRRRMMTAPPDDEDVRVTVIES